MGKEAGACPRCGSTNTSSGPIQDDKDSVWCWSECLDCGRRFKECWEILDPSLKFDPIDWYDSGED